MNNLKRIVALVLILCLLLTFAGCRKTETETAKPEEEEEEVKEETAISFTPGTYTGKGVGFGGEVVIDVTFSEDTITDIKLVSSKETDHVGTPAFDIMFEAIKAHTSTGVDAVSGATLTSNAVLRAVEDAAAQAGCDKNNLRVGKIPFELKPGEKIVDTFDVVVVGAGGAGVSAAASAAQNGATVCIIEKEPEAGGNTLVSGCSFQAVLDCLVWDPNTPDATTGVYEYTGETFEKAKSEKGRLDTLRMILNWSEEPFNDKIENPDAIKSVDDYDLPNRGVHQEYLETLRTLKQQIRAYLDWAEPKLAAGAKETDLTLFSTVELHIFQTYYGGLRLNNDKTKWIYSDYDLVHQLCTEILPTKEWLMDQGSLFQNASSTGTLIGCLWQRINRFIGGMVNGEEIEGKWGAYFAVPLNTVLNANEKNTIMYRTKATELITDSKGRVTGVKAVKYDGTEVEITANMGVILATGGYAYNVDMVIETNDYWNKEDLKPDILSTNRPLAMGEGLLMAQKVGAATKGMDFTQLMPLGWVDTGHLAMGTGENVIYISPSGTPNAGKRYVNESAERDVLCQGAFDYGGENGLFVEISNAGNRTKDNNVAGRLYICTLEEAAELLKIDAETIKNTIIEYDTAVRTDTLHELDVPKSAATALIGNYNEDDSFKEDGLLAVRYLAPSTHHTMGGLVVDTSRRVLDKDGEPIEGLYAAGEVTAGFFAGNRLGGNAVAEIIVSGRIAGESVTKNK
ncbi:MAG: FAD-binding protein [Clostridiaceae bacterium]|jgi:urocanate reductase|nr:FAD-binding protein [Clostridiaceae bacterium]